MTAKHGWPMVRLGDVTEIRSRLIQPEAIEGDTIYLGLEDLEKGGGIKSYPTALTSNIKSAKRVFGEEDILFGRLRPNLQKVALPGLSGACTTDILTIRPSKMIDRHYLYAYLLTPQVLDYTSTRTTGINLPRISAAQLLELTVPLPPLDEQRRIAGILDRSSLAQQAVLRSIGKMRGLSSRIAEETIRAHAVTPTPLGELLTGIESGKSPRCEAFPAPEDEWGVLKLSAVTSGNFLASENKLLVDPPHDAPRREVKSGDILMTRKNTPELVGAVCIVDAIRPRLLFPDLVFRLALDETRLVSSFFQAVMMSDHFRDNVRALASGSAKSMSNISQAKLRTLKFPLPSMSVQQAFDDSIQIIKRQHSTLELRRKLLAELNYSLQTRAFQGAL
ncbi:restriction endonuclease subunit S [Corynebacterium nasicanis]|uniref:Restriction endonuclease subunit S n=1 Tax=Corynebacterium nasicanis TaxID=1448267 RepID=A0ABW1QE27_9CORY